MQQFLLSPKRMATCLFAIVLALAAISVTGHGLQYFYGSDRFPEFVRLFNLSGEQNIPSWFSSMMLFSCALLLGAIAAIEQYQGRQRFVKHWWALALIFLYISVDESSEIHESLNFLLRERFDARGIFYNPWVFPFAGLLLVLVAIYWRFLKHLPRRIAVLFLVSGAVYVSGALGLELVSAFVGYYHSELFVLRGGLATLEDSLEMSGVVLLFYALQSHAISLTGQSDGEGPTAIAGAANQMREQQ